MGDAGGSVLFGITLNGLDGLLGGTEGQPIEGGRVGDGDRELGLMAMLTGRIGRGGGVLNSVVVKGAVGLLGIFVSVDNC